MLLSALALAGLGEAAAQFPPPPGQSGQQTQSSPFPPPPGQASRQQQPSPFPPPPTPGQQQSSPFPPPPQPGQQSSSPFPPPSQSSPFPNPGQGVLPQTGSFSPAPPRPSQPPPGAQPPQVCLQFQPIRDQAEKDGGAIKTASDRKASREEICRLFTRFVASESKMVNFLVTHQKTCGVPPDAIKHVRGQHAKSQEIRKQVCSTGGAPAGPSLSDVLGGPAILDQPPKPGRGTFDTLTGSPLAR
jgi:hypothetical protein